MWVHPLYGQGTGGVPGPAGAARRLTGREVGVYLGGDKEDGGGF